MMASDKYLLVSDCPAGLYDRENNICRQSGTYCHCTNGLLRPEDCNIARAFTVNLNLIVERTLRDKGILNGKL
ncbi:MAG: hypothetical protein ABIE22_04340 [archaeon]